MTRPRTDLIYLLEREIRDVLRDKSATRADKLKAIEAGARIVMTKHRIAEATDGAAGAFFTREPPARSGPERAIRRPAPGPATAAAATNGTATNGAGAASGAASAGGGPEDPGGADPAPTAA